MSDLPTTEPRLIELEPRPCVAVRMVLPMASLDLGAEFQRWMPALDQYVGEHGLEPTGPVYGRYFQFGPDQVDVEIGIPIGASSDGLASVGPTVLGTIGASSLPGGRAASVTHVGPYDGLGRAYDRLHDWIHAQGLEDGIAPWESYTDDAQATDPSVLRTEVTWPLA